MTYSAYESSAHDGAPVELYHFSFGRGSFFYTSSDAPVMREGARYVPEAIARTEIEHDVEDNSGTITVTLPHDNPVANLFRAHLPSSPVRLSIYRTHREDGQLVLAWRGDVTASEFESYACRLTCQPISGRLGRQFPSTLFQSQCTHVLFSQTEYLGPSAFHPRAAQRVGCNVKREAHRLTATLEAVSGLTLTSPVFATKPDGWFTAGIVEFDSGEVRHLTKHIGNTVEMAYPADVGAGAVVSAFPGCDGLETTCKSKFNNVINFLGFNRVPTRNPYSSSLT